MSKKQFLKSLRKSLSNRTFTFKKLNCPSGRHKNHVVLVDFQGQVLTKPTDDPIQALQYAADYFTAGVKFFTEEAAKAEAPTSEDKKSESDLPAELSELVDLLASVFGPGRVKIKTRSTASEKAKPAETETNQTAG